MSKPEKFLNIGISILEARGENPGCSGKQLWNMIRQARNLLEEQGIIYSDEEPGQKTMGTLRVLVLDENGNPTPAQVKLFPLKSGESAKTFHRVNGRIDMIREMTGEDGSLDKLLPTGAYMLEISKGSEYIILMEEVKVTETEMTKSFRLERFVHLGERGYYAGDLHHHSIYSSPVYGGDDDVCETPEEVSCSMRAMGLSYGALSDHHNTLNHDSWRAQEKEDFLPIVSKEISTTNGHVMALGVEKDVIYHAPWGEERTEEALRAEFRSVTEQIRREGGLPQLNHPRDYSVSTSFNPAFYDMLDIFQTMEIWNGSHPMYYGTTNADAAKLWRDLLEQGRYIPAVTGSDTHNIRANDYHELFHEIMWICETLEEYREIREKLAEEYQTEWDCLELLHKSLLPAMEKWAESNLTSGGVRTYVKLEGKPTVQKVLDALRKGQSFLTNGPILYAEPRKEGMALTILGNLPLEQLYIYGSGGYERKMALTEREETQGKKYYDYSLILPWNEEIRECRWLFFVAASDFTNLAITNPTQNMQYFW